MSLVVVTNCWLGKSVQRLLPCTIILHTDAKSLDPYN